MIFGFTGTREGMSKKQQKKLSEILREGDIFRHGGAIGADKEAFEIAKDAGCYTIEHPCNIPNQRAYTRSNAVLAEKNPLERNKDIVNACEVILAAPRKMEEEQRSGTWMTIRYARSAGRTIIFLER